MGLTVVARVAKRHAHELEVRTRWADLGAAADGGEIEKGWIPAGLPMGTFDIVEWHDLDSNRSYGVFSTVDAGLAETKPPADLARALASIREQISDDRLQSISRGKSFYSDCEDDRGAPSVMVVIDRNSGAGAFWSSEARCAMTR